MNISEDRYRNKKTISDKSNKLKYTHRKMKMFCHDILKDILISFEMFVYLP